jgi:bla regulator protein blaR1
MNLLHTIVESPMAAPLGWALLHSLWEGAIIAAVLATALAVLPSPRARYVAGCAAMLALAAGFALTLLRMMPAVAQGLGPANATSFFWWNPPSGADAPAPFYAGLVALVPWLAPVWLAGVLIFALRHAAGWISVSRLRRRGVCCVPQRWQRELARLRARLGVSRPVLLLESCLAEAPMVLGHLRPAILMPIGLLAGLPPAQIEAILLHELAHIRRCDYLVNVMQRAAECLFSTTPRPGGSAG